MREGDCVYLKQPFQPHPTTSITFQQGIVAAIVIDESTDVVTDVLVQLYDPDQNTVYTDEQGGKVLYCFSWDELEPT
ncbi:MAG: hypothetical protein VKJ64_00110 [Leptolyngbyaceae bacterium]|nr:hypothetical protein [Leptolyngbyaceae bacterium]